jgi:hypothetical protein
MPGGEDVQGYQIINVWSAAVPAAVHLQSALRGDWSAPSPTLKFKMSGMDIRIPTVIGYYKNTPERSLSKYGNYDFKTR